MTDTDDPGVQRKRIRLAVNDELPGCSVTFKELDSSDEVSFRIDGPNGKPLGSAKEYDADGVADWSDKELRARIRETARQTRREPCRGCAHTLYETVALDEKGSPASIGGWPEPEFDGTDLCVTCSHCGAKNVLVKTSNLGEPVRLTVSHVK